jgi:hypothetical protein
LGQLGERDTEVKLVGYGIHTEQSDIRAHVSVVARCIYVFETYRGLDAIKAHDPKLVPAFQVGVDGPTATGHLVKTEWIQDLRRVKYHSWHWERFSPDLSTTEKGKLAVLCVSDALRIGRFPMWLNGTESLRKEIQISGTDIIVMCNKRIQVKCDYNGGDRADGGTGNLFLQNAERNPLKRY